jgi:hypothetical protein
MPPQARNSCKCRTRGTLARACAAWPSSSRCPISLYGPFWSPPNATLIDGGRSQGKQDAVARAIFRTIGSTNRQYVEIGFNDNSQCTGSGSNTCQLWLEGWRGTLLDGAHSNASIGLRRELLTSLNVASVLRKYNVPKEVDYLSVDVDSIDLWLLEAILSAGYRPRLISTEFNPNIPFAFPLTYPDASRHPVRYNPGRLQRDGVARHNCYYGASAGAFELLAREFGYAIIGVVEPLDLFMVPRKLEMPALRALHTSRDSVGTLGRFALDEWRNQHFLNVTWPLNQQRMPMTAMQAAELIDYREWRRQLATSTGSAEGGTPHTSTALLRAAAAARLTAHEQVVQIAEGATRINAGCFRHKGHLRALLQPRPSLSAL